MLPHDSGSPGFLRNSHSDVTEDPSPDTRSPSLSTRDAELRRTELRVARDIADSFLTAAAPVEVYRLALARVTPLVDASFASVFLRDTEDPRLLRLECAQNWPQSAARYLGQLRIMEGRGPTGRAVGTGAPVEVADVFASQDMEDWWEPARELGFTSMISLPLKVEGEAFGAVSFYFREERSFSEDERALLGVVAHQLATTAERARVSWDLDDPRHGQASGSR